MSANESREVTPINQVIARIPCDTVQPMGGTVGGLGGKANGLIWLQDHGWNPPPFDVIGTETTRQILSAGGEYLAAGIDEIRYYEDEAALAIATSTVRRAIMRIPPAQVSKVLPALDQWCDQGETLAIRSSALSEDSATSASPGQYDTQFVRDDRAGVIRAILSVIASYYFDRAIMYRRANGIDDGGLAMGVVIQRLVHPTASGVAFSADPVTGDRNTCVLESTYGLGTALVSGVITPDRFRFQRSTLGPRLLTETVGSKRAAHRVDASIPDGVVRIIEHDVSPEDAMRASITCEQAAAIADSTFKIADEIGTPADIEWVIGPTRELHFVQVRPITALPDPPRGTNE